MKITSLIHLVQRVNSAPSPHLLPGFLAVILHHPLIHRKRHSCTCTRDTSKNKQFSLANKKRNSHENPLRYIKLTRKSCWRFSAGLAVTSPTTKRLRTTLINRKKFFEYMNITLTKIQIDYYVPWIIALRIAMVEISQLTDG